MCVEHVTGEEKYDCEMLNVVIMESRMFCGRVCRDSLSGAFFGFLCLYLWYSHVTSVSNGCVWGTSPCVLWMAFWYCCHNHLNLVVGMVMRYLPVSSYILVSSFWVCIVFRVVAISFCGLHSIVEIWVWYLCGWWYESCISGLF